MSKGSSTRPTAHGLKVFVPTKDLDASLAFYTALGWEQNWRVDGLAEIELAESKLYLQSFYNKSWAENFMIYVDVEDAQAWYDHATSVIATGQHPGAKALTPKKQDYGSIVTFVYDPIGVLIHFAQAEQAKN